MTYNRNGKENIFSSPDDARAKIQHYGGYLAYVPDQWMTESLLETAVRTSGKSNPDILQYADERFRTASVCDQAIDANPEALEWVPDQVCNADMCIKAVEADNECIRYVPERFMTEELEAVARREMLIPNFNILERLKNGNPEDDQDRTR